MTVDRLPRCIHELISCSICHNHDHVPDRAEREAAVLEWADRYRIVHPVVYQESVPVERLPVPVVMSSTAAGLHDYVTELAERTTQLVPYTVSERGPDGTTLVARTHRVTEVSLLQQLSTAVATSGAEAGAGAFGSRPAARLDVVATLDTIRRGDPRLPVAGVYSWLTGMNESPTDFPMIADALRKIRSMSPRLRKCRRAKGHYDDETETHCCAFHHLERDASIWWTQARVATGWDSPAFKPNNTCPTCGERGSLRLRLEPTTGVCVDCRTTWTPETIGLLVRHIRHENHDPEEQTA